MLIIPEKELVVILVPRTGTNYIKNAVRKRYPKAFMPYRHMEADGVPFGYDRWRRIGVLRRPVERLFSLYKFLRAYDVSATDPHKQPHMRRLKTEASGSFSDWLVNGETPIATANGIDGSYHPGSATKHPYPEQLKSSHVYLRPDLGTEIIGYSDIGSLINLLDIPYGRTHRTEACPTPKLSTEADQIIHDFHSWDIRECASRNIEEVDI